MAFFLPLINGLMLFGAGAGVVVSGIQASNTLTILQQNTKDLQDQNSSIKDKYKAIQTADAATLVQLEAGLQADITEYIDIQTKISSTILQYSNEQRTVQIWGMIGVIVLIFMLIVRKILDVGNSSTEYQAHISSPRRR